ncbi:MAG: amidase family protein [Negativicutes bacterium]|nr:amidase family protein [Negativicutes bacterium]
MTNKPTGFPVEEATVSQLKKAIREGQLTCRQLAETYLARIEAYDQKGPAINAVIAVNPNAVQIAEEADRRYKAGEDLPLLGIPVLLKDNIDTADMATTAGSACLAGFTPAADAFITKKLKDAGALILAKVNLHEFAVWGETASSIAGQTLNPYDLTRTPGGSSGGTGAAIAANMGSVGIGTDTINSVRSPASANCLVGFRPTLGLVSRHGIIPYSLTQDTAGPITRTVDDAAAVLSVITGYDPRDGKTAWSIGKAPASYLPFLDPQGLKNSRIGVLRSFFGSQPVHAEVNRIMDNSLRLIEEAGGILIDLPETLDSNQIVQEISVHLYDLEKDLDSYLSALGDKAAVHSLKDVIASGKYHPGIGENIKTAVTLDPNSLTYKERLLRQTHLRDQVMKWMADYGLDAIVYPHQKRLVVKVGEAQVDRNGSLAAVTGFPAITVPAGFSTPTPEAPLGVPVGIEFIGRPWSEPILFKIAYGFEQTSRVRRPPQSTPIL